MLPQWRLWGLKYNKMAEIKEKKIDVTRTLPSYGTTRRSLRRFGTRAGKRDIRLGAKTVNAFPGDDIQKLIDQIHDIGGGVIFIKNGTHKLSANLTMYSNVYINGENGHTAILDFQTNAYGIVASGSSAYSTGTVTVSNNSTSVTGNGTTWLTNVVAGMYILLDGIFYPITVVGGNGSITIGIPYAGVALTTAVYVACVPIDDIQINNLTIKNASTGFALTYCSRGVFNDLNIQASVTGVICTDCSLLTFNVPTLVANNAGFVFTRVHYSQYLGASATDTLAGVGLVFTACTNNIFQNFFILNSSGNGISITSCDNLQLASGSVIENGGIGIELVSGNRDIVILSVGAENNLLFCLLLLCLHHFLAGMVQQSLICKMDRNEVLKVMKQIR